jgi:hypothetical protein
MAAMARPRAIRVNVFTGFITVVFMPALWPRLDRGVLTTP